MHQQNTFYRTHSVKLHLAQARSQLSQKREQKLRDAGTHSETSHLSDRLLLLLQEIVSVFYYCRTCYKTVRVGGGGENSDHLLLLLQENILGH